MTKPAKNRIGYAQLLEKVQGLLACCEECGNVCIDGLEVYQEQIDGANWRVINFRRSGGEGELNACREKILADIDQLRDRYDVAESENLS